ncbi:MAG: hypothetical protein H7249_18070 [Chitinophagaceae bacterium]|nr:hypothetical protein [Oligoflexus sp.]
MSKSVRLDWKSTNSVVISGELDESSDLSSLDRCASQICYVDFAKVSRVNSTGLKTWLQTITKNKIQLVLRECSVSIVEQFAMVPQFLGKNGIVESFFAPYHCISCFHEDQKRYQVGQNLDLDHPHIEVELKDPCPECGDVLELEQAPELYLSFLHVRSSQAS